MKKYRVISYFEDLQDGSHPYNVGENFPRKGVSVTADRIKELSGTQNKRGVALIEEVRGAEETAEPDKAAPVENEPRKRTRKQNR